MSQTAPSEGSATGIHALVVDDDAFVCEVVAQQLRQLGATTVVVAYGGAQARAALLSQPPRNLVICDLLMPDHDGIELLRDIADFSPDSALILMSSAESKLLRSAEQIAHGHKLQVLGGLSKPVRTDQIAALLGHIRLRHPTRLGDIEEPPIDQAMLRTALDGGSIVIAAQPQISLRDHRLEGVEILARWPRTGQMPVSPLAFIAAAELHGLLDALTDTIIEKAITTAGNWQRAGLCPRVAVNLAISTLSRPQLPQMISSLAARHGVPCERLVGEVTETGVARDDLSSREVLTRLRFRGIELSIDDFGTGYSSLDRLSSIPFNELKIDRSFVVNARRDEEARRIVASSIRLAQDLGLRTVAEGIETAEDAELMRSLGCDLGQGHYFAAAMSPEELLRWQPPAPRAG